MKKKVKALVEKADRLLRLAALWRDGYSCQITGGWYKNQPDYVECAHYENRDNKRTRWMLDNVWILRGCIHRGTPEYQLNEMFEEKFPDRARHVQDVRNELFHVNEVSMKTICKSLQFQIEFQRGEYEKRQACIESLTE